MDEEPDEARRRSSAPSTRWTTPSATSATSSSACSRSPRRRRVVEGLAALADEFRVNTMIDVELRPGPTVGADHRVPIGPRNSSRSSARR